MVSRCSQICWRITRKNNVVDTNILLHDPQSIFNFADYAVIIPFRVLAEIDRFKKEMTDRGLSVQRVARPLDSLRRRSSLIEGVTPSGDGIVKVYCNGNVEQFASNDDLEVLRTVWAVQKKQSNMAAVIVTKDINLPLQIASALNRSQRMPLCARGSAAHGRSWRTIFVNSYPLCGNSIKPIRGRVCKW